MPDLAGTDAWVDPKEKAHIIFVICFQKSSFSSIRHIYCQPQWLYQHRLGGVNGNIFYLLSIRLIQMGESEPVDMIQLICKEEKNTHIDTIVIRYLNMPGIIAA